MHNVNLRKTIFCTVLLLLVTGQIHARWHVAPATAEGGIEETAALNFTPLSGNRYTDLLLYTKQEETHGWVWLKKDLVPDEYSNYILIHGTNTDWDLWINDNLFGNYKPLSLPVIHDISRFKYDKKISIYLKAFFRRGHAQEPALPEAGNLSQLQREKLFSLVKEPFTHIASILVGLLLIIAGAGKPNVWFKNMAFFGLFLITNNIGKLGLMFGWQMNELWLVPTLVTSCSVPLAVSFWRRTVTDIDNKIKWVSVIDFLFVLLLLTHTYLIQTGVFENSFILDYNPLPIYALMSVVAALELWFYGLVMRWDSRFPTALIMLSPILVAIFSLSLGNSPIDAIDNLIAYGLPLSGLLCVAAVARTGGTNTRRNIEDPHPREKIQTSGHLPGRRFTSSSSENFQNQSFGTSTDQIDRAIRLSFQNRKIPWDSHWDIAATNESSQTSAPSFHDFYISADERIHGFAFFNSELNNTESTVFTQIVRSHLHRHFLTEASLVQLARGASQASQISARTLKANMEGLVACLNENFMNILPVGKPKAILRRSSNGQTIPVTPNEQAPLNPEIGSTAFGKEGIKTLKIPFFANDILLVYSPEIESLRTHTGARIGHEGIKRLLRDPKGVSAKEVLSGITKAISQSATDMPVGLRILVIRNKQGTARA